jgi:hypothetical protein
VHRQFGGGNRKTSYSIPLSPAQAIENRDALARVRPHSPLPTPLPTPHFPLPTPHSPLPTPHSPLPSPLSLSPLPPSPHQEVYSKMFDWLVLRMNKAISSTNNSFGGTPEKNHVSVLDIYGFEIFQKNSLEQFCINYANEKMYPFFFFDKILILSIFFPANSR